MYIAKKICRFAGRKFMKDEPIPDGYVLNTAAPRLISMGVIAEVKDAGPLLPASSSIDDDIPVQEPEPEAEPELETEPEAEPEKVTEESLMELKRDELVTLAESYGIEVNDKDTKKVIATAILGAAYPEGSEE